MTTAIIAAALLLIVSVGAGVFVANLYSSPAPTSATPSVEGGLGFVEPIEEDDEDWRWSAPEEDEDDYDDDRFWDDYDDTMSDLSINDV